MKHELILEGVMKASCSCGGWHYVGILAEAKKAIKEIHSYHAGFDKGVIKPKKKK